MRIIVPMAGMGKRLRPHTLTVPKPLFPIAGKPIVQRLVEDLAKLYGQPIEEVVFVIGAFGPEVEAQLRTIAEGVGAKATIAYQEEALGTAHAILCAGDALEGEIIIAFADTLFTADFRLNTQVDGVIWTKQVEDPRPFGVVMLDAAGHISGMVEKPQTFVSDQAIIGIYYMKDAAALRREMQYLIDNNICTKGEYQLTDALEALRQKGATLVPGTVDRWMDCGNKQNVLDTNRQVLEVNAQSFNRPESLNLENSVVIPPCYIGEGATIVNSVIGPYVAVGAGAHIQDARITESIVREHARVVDVRLHNTIVGVHSHTSPAPTDLNLGDYSEYV